MKVRLPPLNFITVHYAYFIGVCLLSSIIFWGSSRPSRSVDYIDALFLVVSAMTLAGLNTINLSELNTFQQSILFLLLILGSAIWVSIGVVHIRRKAFERKFKSIIEAGRQRRRARSNSRGRRSVSGPISHVIPDVDGVVVRGRAIKSEKRPSAEGVNGDADRSNEQCVVSDHTEPASDQVPEHDAPLEDLEAGDVELGPSQAKQNLTMNTGITRRITFASPSSPIRERQHGRILTMQGVGARQDIENHPLKTPHPIYPHEPPRTSRKNEVETQAGFLLGNSVGRNSQFAGLTLAERERLGGVEYRAVSILAVLVPAYFIMWQLLGSIALGGYVAYNRADATAVNAENPWYISSQGPCIFPFCG